MVESAIQHFIARQQREGPGSRIATISTLYGIDIRALVRAVY